MKTDIHVFPLELSSGEIKYGIMIDHGSSEYMVSMTLDELMELTQKLAQTLQDLKMDVDPMGGDTPEDYQ